MKKKIILLTLIPLILVFIILCILYIHNFNTEKKEKQRIVQEEIEKKEVLNNYNTYVKAKKNINLYDKNHSVVGKISKGTYITLDDNYKIDDKYYKLLDSDYYVLYSDVTKTEFEVLDMNEYKTYKNYIPYDENIKTNDEYKLYLNDNDYFEINEPSEFNIIIKSSDQYGVEFNNHLAYIKKSDVNEVIQLESNNIETLKSVAVLNYHFTIDANSDERRECVQDICIPETQVDEQIKYLKENNFYSLTMRDLYLFLNDQIQLPSKSVVITIDDGWYVHRMINILNKYQMSGTLFLIGSLASPNDYLSEYLEIHSHSWDLHTPNVCRGEHGGGILCLDEQVILEDLKKSRESLNNTTVFCFPFYEYNDRAINLLKQSGFEMAFVGGNVKTNKNNNIFKIPRYVMYDGMTMDRFKIIVN